MSFYDPSRQPVARPYFHDKPTIKMPASYDDYNGEFSIDLWEKGKDFKLDILHEEKYDLDKFKSSFCNNMLFTNDLSIKEFLRKKQIESYWKK